MSDKIGTVAFESGHDEVFIGRTMTQGRSYSEAVAAQIDQEVQRLVADAYDRCERILNDNRDKLEARGVPICWSMRPWSGRRFWPCSANSRCP